MQRRPSLETAQYIGFGPPWAQSVRDWHLSAAV